MTASLVAQAQISWPAVLPTLAIAVGASAILLLTALGSLGRRLAPFVSLATLFVAHVLAHRLTATGGYPYHGFIAHDAYGTFATQLFILGAALVTLVSWRHVAKIDIDHPEYHALVLFAATGMIVMSQAMDLLAFFLGLEILSLALYALTGLSRSADAVEAALKYFLLGAFAAGFYLMGSALLFGASESTRFDRIVAAGSPLAGLGAALVLSAIGFKLALPPFHMWAPDAYQGAPSPVTAFMAFGTKAAVFFAVGRIVHLLHGTMPDESWRPVAVSFSVAAMVWGNTVGVAVARGHIRRLLAYSSISHAGTILLGLAAGTTGLHAVLVYLVAYTFSIVGVFAVVVAVERRGGELVHVKDLVGLSRTSPLLAALLTLFLLSLAGFPPTAGFLGKLLVFRAALGAEIYLATIAGALASAAGAFYYLYVVVAAYMREPRAEDADALRSDLGIAVALALVLAFVGTLPLGIFPERLLGLASEAARSLGS